MDYFSNFQIIARKKHGKKHFSSLYYIDVVFLVRFNNICVALKTLHSCILASLQRHIWEEEGGLIIIIL